MIERQALHIFQGGGSLFGFTEDRTGSSLPTDLAPQGWTYHSSISVVPGEGPRAGVAIEDIQAKIRTHGFCIKKDAITVTHLTIEG